MCGPQSSCQGYVPTCIRLPKQLRTHTTVITASSMYVQRGAHSAIPGAAEDLEHFLLQCPALQAVLGRLSQHSRPQQVAGSSASA